MNSPAFKYAVGNEVKNKYKSTNIMKIVKASLKPTVLQKKIVNKNLKGTIKFYVSKASEK